MTTRNLFSVLPFLSFLAACGGSPASADSSRNTAENDLTALPSPHRIATGHGFTCAVAMAGTVKCWGINLEGELGNGSTFASSTPLPVWGLTGVSAVAAGTSHACALTTRGSVMCWGANDSGQLGNGSNILSFIPVAVTGLAYGVTAIAAGGNDTCALTFGGAVQCWGDNSNGQLGDGTTTDSATPVAAGLTGVTAITTSGDHACAITTGGVVQCWGNNDRNQAGVGPMNNSPTPAPVQMLQGGVTAIATGPSETYALAADSSVQCWGDCPTQLQNNYLPAPFAGLPSAGITSIVAGAYSCAVINLPGLESLNAECWGGLSDPDDPIGDTSITYSDAPVPVTGIPSNVATISTNDDHACAITTTGTVQCWGSNKYGELGNSTVTTSSATPVDVVGL